MKNNKISIIGFIICAVFMLCLIVAVPIEIVNMKTPRMAISAIVGMSGFAVGMALVIVGVVKNIIRVQKEVQASKANGQTAQADAKQVDTVRCDYCGKIFDKSKFECPYCKAKREK